MATAYAQFTPFPTASQYPQRSGIEIPQIWSKQIAAKFYNKTVLSSISTTKWEGEIRKEGDNVAIRIRPTMQVRRLVKNQPLKYDNPQATVVTLPVNKGLYWATQLDDVDKQQFDIDWQPLWHEDAAQALKESIDTEVLAFLPSNVGAHCAGANAGTSGTVNLGTLVAPVKITKTTACDIVVDCGQVCDEMNIPEEGRYIILPPPFMTRLKTGELKAVSTTGDAKSPLRNGLVGNLDKFSVFASNLLHHQVQGANDVYQVVFGWSGALAFASTINNTESLRATEFFGDLIRGKQIYGYEVVNEDAVCCLHCYHGTDS